MVDEDLAVGEALEEIERVDQRYGALERRAAGLTWMIWGIVAPAIFVTYSYVGVVFDAYSASVEVLFPFLWAPWVLLGVIATRALWRSVGLVMPVDIKSLHREGVLTMVVILVLIFGGFWLVGQTGARMLEPATALLGLGVATAGFGVLNINVGSSFERAAAGGAGVFLVLIALVATLVLPADGTGYAWLSIVAPGAGALAYFGVGGLMVLRG